MQKINVAGLKIDAFSKPELMAAILQRLKNQQQTWVTTVYSEFLFTALKDSKVMEMLNKADIAVPDGVGIFWASKYLSLPLTAKSFYGKILQALWQLAYSLIAILFNSKWIYYPLNSSHKIPGSELVWDLAEMAEKNKLSVYLLGGFGDTSELVAKKLKTKHPQLNIVGFSNKNPGDKSIINGIQKAQPDFLFVAFGPIKQENWINSNLKNLPAKVIIGLGGTFDYLAKKQPTPPQFMRSWGLEWLWRLVTQPKRYKRIFNATFGLMSALWHFKVFNSMPFRQNVVSVILNNQKGVLICKRNPEDPDNKIYGYSKKDVTDHWQFPQGGMNEEEDFIATAKRECLEEVSLTNIQFIKLSEKKHLYNWPNALRSFFGSQYKMRGQEQHIVYFKHLGKNTDVKIDNKEFINYNWVKIEELKSVIHSQRINLAEIITADLKEMAEKAII